MVTSYICSECAHTSLQWVGRCPSCGKWDSLCETSSVVRKSRGNVSVIPLSAIDPTSRTTYSTGITEFDRVLGEGLVSGSVVLLAGEPGVGKSTLTLQAAAGLEASGVKVLMVNGEESPEQIAHRAARVGGLGSIGIVDSTDLDEICSVAVDSDVVIVDSIQTVRDRAIPSPSGSVSQVRGCAMKLGQIARDSHLAVLLVGHVTKDGSVAGPKVLEHIVDAVLTFEGDSQGTLRTLRGTKNRFGPAWEIGVFEMNGGGLRQVTDASSRFLADRRSGSVGSAVGCAIEGRRPIAFEVQALVSNERGGSARRVANGLESSRLGVLLAALSREIHVGSQDVFASVPGGLKLADPGADLAVVLALASAFMGQPLAGDIVAIGEVGLGGEVRAISGAEARLNEATRMGFARILGPASAFEGSDNPNFTAIAIDNISEALTTAISKMAGEPSVSLAG
jgi:DNA repair protein RadA/Sms